MRNTQDAASFAVQNSANMPESDGSSDTLAAVVGSEALSTEALTAALALEPADWGATAQGEVSVLHRLCANPVLDVDTLRLAAQTTKTTDWTTGDDTPLHLLCQRSEPELLRVVSEFTDEAAWLAHDSRGNTIMHCLCGTTSAPVYGPINAEMLRAASDAAGAVGWRAKQRELGPGASDSLRDSCNDTPLHRLCSVFSGDLDPSLLRDASSCAGPDAWRTQGAGGRTPLHVLCANDRCGLSVDLLEIPSSAVGSDIWTLTDRTNFTDDKLYGRPGGYTALHELCRNPQVTAQLLQFASEQTGADGWRLADAQGRTPCHHLVCDQDTIPAELINTAAKNSGTALLQDFYISPADNIATETVLLESVFKNHPPDDFSGALEWLTHENLWAQAPAAGKQNYNPLAVATALKHGPWVKAIVDLLLERTLDDEPVLKYALMHRTVGMSANIAALFDMDYGVYAVMLLSEAGVLNVPGTYGAPHINPEAGLLYACCEDRFDCEIHDRLIGDFDSRSHSNGSTIVQKDNGQRATTSSKWGQVFLNWQNLEYSQLDSTVKSMSPRDRDWNGFMVIQPGAQNWTALAQVHEQFQPAWSLLPQKRIVRVPSEPVMFGIDGASRPGRKGLLGIVLKHTQRERYNEVFASELIYQLIKFKWQTYGQQLFFKETAVHMALVVSWTIVACFECRDDISLWKYVGTAEAVGAASCCIFTGLCFDTVDSMQQACLLRGLLLLLVALPAVAAGVILSAGGTKWFVVAATVILISVAARNVRNEILQLRDATLSAADFNEQYPPTQQLPSSKEHLAETFRSLDSEGIAVTRDTKSATALEKYELVDSAAADDDSAAKAQETIEQQPLPKPAKFLFDHFDTDATGLLTKQNFKAYIQAIGLWETGNGLKQGSWVYRYTDDPTGPGHGGGDGWSSGRNLYTGEDTGHCGFDEGWVDDCEELGCTTAGVPFSVFENKIYGELRTGTMNNLDADLQKVFGKSTARLQQDLHRQFQEQEAMRHHIEWQAEQRDLTVHRRIQRYALGLNEYLDDPWNVIDVASLISVCVCTLLQLLQLTSAVANAQLSAVATSLIWVRVIQYMNGLDATAAYVRMTLSVMSDMWSFMLIIAILILGNTFVLMMLYPSELLSERSSLSSAGIANLTTGVSWNLTTVDEQTVRDSFGSVEAALFTSINMLFFGEDTQLLDFAPFPAVSVLFSSHTHA
eukprot:COSAG02_NODE_2175_length_9589_cov_6.644573_3_plen_1201_part_00